MVHAHKYTNRVYLDTLQQRVLIFDGAMGTSLQALGLTPEQFGGEQSPQVGVQIALELIDQIKSFASGIYLMPQFGRYDLAEEIVDNCR